MSVHDQFAEDLALYALNALSGDERTTLEQHLADCPSCRLELEELRGDGALLALSTSGPKPPQRSRQRLLDAVAREPRVPVKVQETAPRRWWPVPLWNAVAVAVLVFAYVQWKENIELKKIVATEAAQSAQTKQELEDLRKIAAPIISPESQSVQLVWTALKLPPSPQGKAMYLRNRGSLVFLASNLPPLPTQKTYELWLIPHQGAPIPAGLFRPDARGSATVVNPPLPAGTQAKAFAITIEDAAGATTPTMPIVMMGAGE